MLPGSSIQVAGAAFQSPELSPSAMSAAAAAAAHEEESIFGVGADDTFFSIYALASTPPPTSTATSPALQWPTSGYTAPPALSEPGGAGVGAGAGAATPTPYPTKAPSMGGAKDTTLPASSSSFDFGGPHPGQDRVSPLLGPLIPPSSQPLQGAVPPLFPPGGSPDPAGGEGLVAPVDAAAAAAAAAGMVTAQAEMGTKRPPATAATPAPRPAKSATGSSKSRAKGGACQARRSKSNAQAEGDPDDPGPDTKVCLLAVGRKQQQQQIARVGNNADTNSSSSSSSAVSLGDMVKILTVEIDRNGRETETDYVETGQRAVLQVEALARFDLRYGIVVLEVQESVAAATATARELRFVCACVCVGGRCLRSSIQSSSSITGERGIIPKIVPIRTQSVRQVFQAQAPTQQQDRVASDEKCHRGSSNNDKQNCGAVNINSCIIEEVCPDSATSVLYTANTPTFLSPRPFPLAPGAYKRQKNTGRPILRPLS